MLRCLSAVSKEGDTQWLTDVLLPLIMVTDFSKLTPCRELEGALRAIANWGTLKPLDTKSKEVAAHICPSGVSRYSFFVGDGLGKLDCAYPLADFLSKGIGADSTPGGDLRTKATECGLPTSA